MSKPANRFSFLDDSEVIRRLGIDRATLEQLIQQKRLRTYGGVGKGAFFKLADVEAVYTELHPTTEIEEDEAVSAESQPSKPARPQHDPAMRVHLRLQADLKWFDIHDSDIDAWFRELRSDAYQRQQGNIQQVIRKLQRMVDLIEGGSATPDGGS